jgi:hypothetical protein
MRNITVTVSDRTYHQSRVWAAQRGTSISRVVAFLLNTLPDVPRSVLRGFDPVDYGTPDRSVKKPAPPPAPAAARATTTPPGGENPQSKL